MKSLIHAGQKPAGVPLIADDILELHAARLLLLFHVCGTKNRIDSLTKMAKLDFFVRYPGYFAAVCAYLGKHVTPTTPHVESSMMRYHYGPWDERYYRVLAYLEGRQLLTVDRTGNAFQFELTPQGLAYARSLMALPSFQELVTHMKAVKHHLGSRKGSGLKQLIYTVFDKEVAQRKLKEVIK